MRSRARVQGLAPAGVRALLVRQPWSLESELTVGVVAGSRTFAVRVGDDRRLIYEEIEQHVEPPALLRLTQEELDAVAVALLAEARPEDATLDALRDTRSTRDRLLGLVESLVEDRWGDRG